MNKRGIWQFLLNPFCICLNREVGVLLDNCFRIMVLSNETKTRKQGRKNQ